MPDDLQDMQGMYVPRVSVSPIWYYCSPPIPRACFLNIRFVCMELKFRLADPLWTRLPGIRIYVPDKRMHACGRRTDVTDSVNH